MLSGSSPRNPTPTLPRRRSPPSGRSHGTCERPPTEPPGRCSTRPSRRSSSPPPRPRASTPSTNGFPSWLSAALLTRSPARSLDAWAGSWFAPSTPRSFPRSGRRFRSCGPRCSARRRTIPAARRGSWSLAPPATVSVETTYDPGAGVVRATATGAVALEAGAASREPTPEPALLEAAASALEIPGKRLNLIASNDFYRVFSENGSGRVAVIDTLGGVALAEQARRVLVGEGDQLATRLRDEVDAATVNLGVASMLPRVSLVCGARILDMSDARRAEEILVAAERALADHGGTAVAVVTR